MPLFEITGPIHAKHILDGYPLCWDLEEDGIFEASFNDGEVTCTRCIKHMKED